MHLTPPHAKPTEIKTPIRTYRHPDSASRVTFVGTQHAARPDYFTQLTQIITALQDDGAHIYYEHIRAPTPEELAAAPQDLVKAAQLMTQRLQTGAQDAADMGLAYQVHALPWQERGWQIHDITTLQMAQAYGYTPKQARQQARQLKLARFINARTPPAQRHAQMLYASAARCAVTAGNVGIAVVLDKPDRDLAALREAIVFDALDKQLTDTPDAHFALIWGHAHLPGFDQGLTARGYQPVSQQWLTAIDTADIPTLATTL